MTIRIANNDIAQQKNAKKNAKRTKTLVDKMRSKAYDLAILNVTIWIKSNNGKTPYGIFRLTARVLLEVCIEISSDTIRKQVKKRGGNILADASPREYTAPVQEIGVDQESEMSPLYGTEGAEEQYPPTRNLGGRPHESTLANKKKREDEIDVCYCAITNIYIAKKK